MDNYLPKIAGISHKMRHGRSVLEGYQRGWGLEFGELRTKVAQDDDFRAAMKLGGGQSVVSADRLMNLFLLIKFYLPRLPFGHIIEFGTFRGGSAFFMAAVAEKHLPGAQIFALDTFSGMPQTDKRIDAHNRGDFSNTNLGDLLNMKNDYNLTNIHFIKGLFSETASQVLDSAGTVALAHIDCDIYEPVRYAYSISLPYMVSKGYIVFDDATSSSCIGATEAVEEYVIQRDGLRSEQIFPHYVFRAPE